MSSVPVVDAPEAVESEVADLLCELIRINTSNPTHAERPAAEWTAERLDEAGVEARIIEASPGRASVIARIASDDPLAAPLLVHGHLDVVPADPAEWSVDPFAGELRDGYVWGRGAVDMKDMDAMMLTLVRRWARTGRKPSRDVVLALVADEEAGGEEGAKYLVREHAELFEGCDAAIGEVGGFSVSLGDQARLYLIQTAEKGLRWLRLRAEGRSGHGSMVHEDNAVTRLAGAVSRIGRHRFPFVVPASLRPLVDEISAVIGAELDVDDPDPWLSQVGGLSRMVGAALSNTANPTTLRAGSTPNVVPSSAEATIDARFLPDEEDRLMATLAELSGDGLEWEPLVRSIAVEAPFEGDLVDAMSAALKAEDPEARPVPYLFSGGTDAKAFSTLGIRCFGFAPLLLPPDLDFASLFHGSDERVPVEGLEFGVRVLDRLLSPAGAVDRSPGAASSELCEASRRTGVSAYRQTK